MTTPSNEQSLEGLVEHPEDECECGDYRRDHENGHGRCRMPDALTHANKACFSFRLAFPHSGPASRNNVRARLSALKDASE